MLATERLFEIEEAYGEKVQSLVPPFETCLEEVMKVVLSSEEGG